MDRVILTSLFINHSERDSAKQYSPETADLAFAWLPGLGTGDIEDLSNAFSSKPSQIKITLGQFLDGVIEDGHFSDSSPIRHPQHQALIERIIDEAIVIEWSPPELSSLSNLLKLSPSHVAAGTYIGLKAAEGNYIVLVTVPGGIILVGIATEIVNSLRNYFASKNDDKKSKGRTPPLADASAQRGLAA